MGNSILYTTYDGLLDPLGKSQVLPYLRGLSKKGQKFFVISYEKQHRFSNEKNVLALRKELQAHDISWHPMRYYKRPYFLGVLGSIIKGIVNGVQIVWANDIQVIHARSYVAGAMSYLLKKVTRKKFVFDIRGLWVDERVDGGLLKKDTALYKIAKYCEKKFFLSSDVIIVLTERAKEEIQSLSFMRNKEIPIEVIPTCADLKRFRFRRKDKSLIDKYKLNNKLTLLYFGSLGAWHLLEEMVDFFKILKSKKPNSHLVLLINNNLKEAEELMYVKNLKKEDFTILFVPYEEVPRWLSVTDASIIFYRPSYSLLARSPTKLGESLACGVPVVINQSIGDSDSIVSSNKVGVIVHRFSHTAYKKAVEELLIILRSKNLKQRLVQTGKEYFSLNRGVETYAQVYSYLDIKLL